jgi:hypothetical protein
MRSRPSLAASEILPEVTNPGVAARLAFEKNHADKVRLVANISQRRRVYLFEE